MMPSSVLARIRRLALGLLLLAAPACGLSDYEALMHEAQEHKARFDEEETYLDQPLQTPTRKDEKGNVKPLANLFFRPPKGIEPKAQQLDDLRWRYPVGRGGSNFLSVEMAFAETNDNEFAQKILDRYVNGSPDSVPRQIKAPGQETPTTFDVWEFSNGQTGYSINIPKGTTKPIAIVYIYNKAKQADARKAIDLSLQSLGVDQRVLAAHQRFQKSPWKLKAQPSP